MRIKGCRKGISAKAEIVDKGLIIIIFGLDRDLKARIEARDQLDNRVNALEAIQGIMGEDDVLDLLNLRCTLLIERPNGFTQARIITPRFLNELDLRPWIPYDLLLKIAKRR